MKIYPKGTFKPNTITYFSEDGGIIETVPITISGMDVREKDSLCKKEYHHWGQSYTMSEKSSVLYGAKKIKDGKFDSNKDWLDIDIKTGKIIDK